MPTGHLAGHTLTQTATDTSIKADFAESVMKQKQNHLALTKQTQRRQVQSGGPDNATSYTLPPFGGLCLGLCFFFYIRRLQLQVPRLQRVQRRAKCIQTWGCLLASGVGVGHESCLAQLIDTKLTSRDGNGIGDGDGDGDGEGLLEAFRVFEVL